MRQRKIQDTEFNSHSDKQQILYECKYSPHVVRACYILSGNPKPCTSPFEIMAPCSFLLWTFYKTSWWLSVCVGWWLTLPCQKSTMTLNYRVHTSWQRKAGSSKTKLWSVGHHEALYLASEEMLAEGFCPAWVLTSSVILSAEIGSSE